MKVQGIVYHHFHGEYSATVVLGTDSPEAARDVCRTLGVPWRVATSNPRAVLATLAGEAFEAWKAVCKDKYKLAIPKCGRRGCRGQCEAQEIDGVPHSVDEGPVFTLEIVTTAEEQASLL